MIQTKWMTSLCIQPTKEPTSSNRNSNQVVDKSEDKVDPDPLDGLFREVNTADHIQQVILKTREQHWVNEEGVNSNLWQKGEKV